MATTTAGLVFHFPVGATPTKIPKLLQVLLYTDSPIVTAKDLENIAFAENTDTNRFDEAQGFAKDVLGLIEWTKAGFVLTPRAHVLLRKRESVQYDLLHYLFYTAWCAEEPAKQTRSWFYRTICNNLWGMQEIILDNTMRQNFTQELDGQIRLEFQDVAGFSEKLSLGVQTMNGAMEWLCHLSPTVIASLDKEDEKFHRSASKGDEKFHRRATCSPELFLLALSRSYQLSNAEIGVDMLISPQRRDEISRLCLLDLLEFDRMLDWMLPMYPQFISQGTRTGSYGRFVRLHRFATVESLV
jgi:hypothetical protein